MHEEISDGDSISESGSETIEREGHNEDDLDEEIHDDGCNTDEDDGGPDSDEDDVHFRQKVAELDPLELASFDQELRAVVQESMEQRKLELRSQPSINMVIPMNAFEGSCNDPDSRVGCSGRIIRIRVDKLGLNILNMINFKSGFKWR